MIRCGWLGAWLIAWPALAAEYSVTDYEEPGGFSLALVRSLDGEVYGGGLESGVWWRGTPVFGEIFGHWLSNKLQGGNYYSIGMNLRLMPHARLAPFAGVGGSYNGLVSEHRSTAWLDESFRPADSRYWNGFAEAGVRYWLRPGRTFFFEAGYRRHWTDTGTDFDYDWISIEYGQLF